MKAGIQISIPTPCHENWDAMTPETKGRFCGSCSKTVIDFTLMTDKQIIDTISRATDNICGRVQTTQLKRNLIINDSPLWQQPKWVKYAAATLLMFKLSMPEAHAQKGKIVCKPPTEVKTPPIRMGMMIAKPKPPEIKDIVVGRIVEQPASKKSITQLIKIINNNTAQIINDAVITSATTSVNIAKLSPGLFKITMPINTQPVLEILATDFIKQTITLNKIIDVIYLNPIENNMMSEIGEVIIVKTYPTLFKKSNITLAIKEASTKNIINNVQIAITENNTNIIVFNKKTNSSEITVENLTKNIKYDVKISATNYKDTIFTINKADYKKGKFVIPVFITKIADKEMEELTTLKLMPNFLTPNSVLQIAINAPKQEAMMLALISQEGKYLQTQKVSTVKGDQIIRFTIDSNIKPQMAFVKLMNAKGQWVATEKLIIQ